MSSAGGCSPKRNWLTARVAMTMTSAAATLPSLVAMWDQALARRGPGSFVVGVAQPRSHGVAAVARGAKQSQSMREPMGPEELGRSRPRKPIEPMAKPHALLVPPVYVVCRSAVQRVQLGVYLGTTAQRKMSTLTSSAASSLVSKARTALRRASTAAHVVSVLVATQQQRDQVGLAPGLIEEGDEDGDAALPEASLALAGPMSYMQLALTAPSAWGIAQEVDKCASTSEAVALDGESEFATSPGSPRDQHEAPRLCAVYASLMSAKRLGIACHAARVEVAAWVKSGVVDGGAAALEMVVEVLTSHVEFCVDAVSPVMHGAAHQRWDDDELHRFLAALGDDKRLSQFVEPRATACCRVLHTDRVIAVCARNALSLSLTTMLVRARSHSGLVALCLSGALPCFCPHCDQQTARATQQGEDAAAFAPVLLRVRVARPCL